MRIFIAHTYDCCRKASSNTHAKSKSMSLGDTFLNIFDSTRSDMRREKVSSVNGAGVLGIRIGHVVVKISSMSP